MLMALLGSIFFLSLNAQAAIDGDTSPINDVGLPYQFNSDQEELYRQALAQAKANNKLLIVILGRNDCGWCTRLDNSLNSPSLSAQFKDRYEFQNIATFVKRAVADGNKTHFKIDSGLAVEAQLAALAGMNPEDIKGAPYLFIIDPGGADKPKAVGFGSNPFLASGERDGKKIWYIDEEQLIKTIADAATRLDCAGLL